MPAFNPFANGRYLAGNCVEIWMEDGIIHVLYLDHAEITPAIKQEMYELFLFITKGEKHPFLFASAGSLWYTKAARDYAAEIESKQPYRAVAMFAPSLGYRLIAEFYGKFNKPATPYKVFKDKEEALKWLKAF